MLIGSPEGDTIVGEAGDDTLSGGGGNDNLRGDAGADDLSGGDGQDEASYAGATAPLQLSIGDSANNGAAGEGDDIHDDIEALAGGSGNDVLIGNAGANRLIASAARTSSAAGPGRTSYSGGTTAMSSTRARPRPRARRLARPPAARGRGGRPARLPPARAGHRGRSGRCPERVRARPGREARMQDADAAAPSRSPCAALPRAPCRAAVGSGSLPRTGVASRRKSASGRVDPGRADAPADALCRAPPARQLPPREGADAPDRRARQRHGEPQRVRLPADPEARARPRWVTSSR